jgi:phosphohistidine phosphatase
MKLYLMRHGIAHDSADSGVEVDSQRPLTAEGREKITRIAQALANLGLKPDLILSSPYVRAEQTATILAKEFGRKKNLRFSDLLIPTGKADAILSEIVKSYLVNELFIVGHEPCLSLLISALATVNADLAIQMKKGGVCCLSVHDLRLEQRAAIEWLVTPKILLRV